MQNKTCILFTLLLLLSAQLFGQTEDYLLGTFTNSETKISLTVSRRADQVYEGKVLYQGAEYPYEGIRLLGTLQAEYQYEGKSIPFSLELSGTTYNFVSEGFTLEMQRTSTTVAKSNPSSTVTTSMTMSAKPPAAGGNVTPATGTLVKDPYGTFTLNAPAGWQTHESNGSVVITKSGDPIQMAVSSHNYASRDAIRADALDISNEGQELYLKASTQNFGDNGIIVRWNGTREGQPFAIEVVSLCSPYGGGIVIVGSGDTSIPQFTSAHSDMLMSMAKTVKFTQPVVSAGAQQWITSLSNKQLVYLQTSNGGTEREDIDLCTNGNFVYKYENSYSSSGYADFSYAGNDLQEGTWKVQAKGTANVLVLYFGGSSIREFTLVKGSAAGEVLLNSKRYFIQGASRCN